MSRIEFHTDRVNGVLFLTICAIGLLMRLVCTTGLIGSDDLWYSHFAQLIAKLQYRPESIHFALRYGLTIPVAAMYRFFGIHEWTTYVVPLAASAASVPLLMSLGARLFGIRAGLLAGALLATFSVSLLYATILVPEPVAGFYILLAVLLYVESDERNPIVFGAFAGLALGISYVTKESAAFVVLALLLDAILRHRWKAAVGVGIGALTIVLAEHAYYLASTGDLFFRMHSMKVHEQSPAVLNANQNLQYRLLKAYPRLMLVPSISLGLHSLFALVAVAVGLIRWRPSRAQLLILWFAAPWLYLNFGSSSLTHFTALPVADRYLEFCYAPIFLLTGALLDHWMEQRPKTVRPVLACITLVAAVGFSCGYALHGRGWHTADIAVLRQIADGAKQGDLTTVRFLADPDERWQRSMGILAPGLHATGKGNEDLLIGVDALDLPSVVSVSHNEGKSSR